MADISPANSILMADSFTNPANMPATLAVKTRPAVAETKAAPEKDFNLMAFSATNPANMRAGLTVKPRPAVEESVAQVISQEVTTQEVTSKATSQATSQAASQDVIAPAVTEVVAEDTIPVVATVTLVPADDSDLMALSATNPANMPAGVFRPTVIKVVEQTQSSHTKAVDPPVAKAPVEIVTSEPTQASVTEPVVLTAPEPVQASVPKPVKAPVEKPVEPTPPAPESVETPATESAPSASIPSPFPISHIGGRYLLFDVDVISHARRTHNITGVLVGTIPNLSQQNVFLGVPLELQPEEARVLVEQGHAYIIDDAEVHRKGMLEMSREERLKFLREMDRQGTELASAELKRSEERAEKALKEKGLLGKRNRKDKSDESNPSLPTEDSDSTLFDATPTPPTPAKVSEKKPEPVFITPTTSYPPLTTPPTSNALPLPEVPKSYPLFRFLHKKGYFMMPGLRFGCHYSVYPGDTLRFHSHYLATGLDWDEEFELKDLIGGGRLANRVKKAYLLGGEVKVGVKDEVVNGEEVKEKGAQPVRAFSIEWAGL